MTSREKLLAFADHIKATGTIIPVGQGEYMTATDIYFFLTGPMPDDECEVIDHGDTLFG